MQLLRAVPCTGTGCQGRHFNKKKKGISQTCIYVAAAVSACKEVQRSSLEHRAGMAAALCAHELHLHSIGRAAGMIVLL